VKSIPEKDDNINVESLEPGLDKSPDGPSFLPQPKRREGPGHSRARGAQERKKKSSL